MEQAIIERILDKEGLRDLDKDFAVDVTKRHLTKKILARMSEKNFLKSSEFKVLLKAVRKDLRIVKGVFSKARQKKLKECLSKGDFDSILDMRVSTRERKREYPLIFKDINLFFSGIFGKEKIKVLDLGCGINPVMAVRLLKNVKRYDAYDIAEEDIRIVKEFFKTENVKGDVNVLNILKPRRYSADAVFLFKVLDVLEYFEKGISEQLINSLDAKAVIISFSKISIGGRMFRKARRLWLERIISKYRFFTKDYGNEIFYFIDKREKRKT